MTKSTKNKLLNKLMLMILIITLIFGAFFCVFSINFPIKYKKNIILACEKYNLDESLVFSLINAESHFNSNKMSQKGAIGLMQIMPSTATFIAMELEYETFDANILFNAEINIEFGTFYINYLNTKFENYDVVICAYNAGETIVREWLNDERYSHDGKTLSDIPYVETKNYLEKIKQYQQVYKKIL